MSNALEMQSPQRSSAVDPEPRCFLAQLLVIMLMDSRHPLLEIITGLFHKLSNKPLISKPRINSTATWGKGYVWLERPQSTCMQDVRLDSLHIHFFCISLLVLGRTHLSCLCIWIFLVAESFLVAFGTLSCLSTLSKRRSPIKARDQGFFCGLTQWQHGEIDGSSAMN